MMNQSSPAKKNQKNHFPWCLAETGTKWLCQTEFSNALYSTRSSSESLSSLAALEVLISIRITDEALTADKTQGSQFRKKVVPYRWEITVDHMLEQ